MSDGVKFIFKTLFKVPFIIFAAFFVFNIWAFFYIYFQMLGFSYVVMQTAVENNYLPNSELTTLVNYAYSLEENFDPANGGSGMLRNSGIIVGMNGTDYVIVSTTSTPALVTDDARTKRQYGKPVTVGIACDYSIVWPLDYRETTSGETGVAGLDETATTSFKSDTELENDRAAKTGDLKIRLAYTVPGLKYYPDLLTY